MQILSSSCLTRKWMNGSFCTKAASFALWDYVTFYKYVPFSNVTLVQQALNELWQPLGILGRVYVAQEGINAQLAVPVNKREIFEEKTRQFGPEIDFPLANIYVNASPLAANEDRRPFTNLKIRTRAKLVADDLNEPLNLKKNGTEISPDEWNVAMEKSESIVLDCRNFYEHDVGRFDGAHRIMVESFRDSFTALDTMLEDTPKNTPLLTYCTGGIRCEKVGAYLHTAGFENIFRLQGGIVHYLTHFGTQQEQEQHNLKNRNGHEEKAEKVTACRFLGKNFVFDDRLSEHSRGSEDILGHCFTCHTSCDVHVNCANTMCHGLILQCPKCSVQYAGACSVACATQVRHMKTMGHDDRKEYRKKNTVLWKHKNPSSYMGKGGFRPRYTPAFQKNYSTERDTYASNWSSSSNFATCLSDIRENTKATCPRSHMLIEDSQVQMIQFLLSSWNVQHVLELGCFTGFSALAMAESLPKNGTVTTCDIDPTALHMARDHIKKHPLGYKIHLHSSSAQDLLHEMVDTHRQFDFIFIDANKGQYRFYYDFILRNALLAHTGIMAFDNTLFKDRVWQCTEKEKIATKMHAFNEYVHEDKHTRNLMIPLFDGITFVTHNNKVTLS